MSDPEPDPDSAIKAVWAAIRAVRARPGSQDKADALGRLGRGLREASNAAYASHHAEIIRIHDAEGLSLGKVAQRFGISKTRAQQIIGPAGRRAVEEEAQLSEPSTEPEPVPVVVVIVTSHEGVLMGRRNDGKPLWGFISGEIEPGESPADAAVREVKEETGLRITTGSVIGRRVHPKTGRSLVYVQARPVRGNTVVVSDAEELAELKWVSLAEAEELTGGEIFGPVRQHLRSRLGK